jgi:hypothetical protein
MKDAIEGFLYFTLFWAWMVGIALAHGVWSTLSACLFPPYALYLVAEWFVMEVMR